MGPGGATEGSRREPAARPDERASSHRPLRAPSPSRLPSQDELPRIPPPPPWWEGTLRYAWLALVPLAILAFWTLTEAGPESGDIEITGRRVGFSELAVGHCFSAPDVAVTRAQVEGRSCSEPHQYEVVAVVSYPLERGTAYPGDEALLEYVWPRCTREFEAYVGIPYERSNYWMEPWSPTQASWEGGFRDTICAAYHPDDSELEGSIRGAQR